jgi:hypothetical protein
MIRLHFPRSLLAAAVLAALPVAVLAAPQSSFQRIATYVVCQNTSCDTDIVEETASEIVTASKDGMTLVYSDSPGEQIGFVDIKNPEAPVGLGALKVGGEPTSVATVGDWLLVAVNTSASYATPSGKLAVYHLPTCLANMAACTPVREIDMGGQPDSVAASKDGRYAAVAIENERDEDVTVDGVEGGLPQLPAGYLNIVDLVGAPAAWTVRKVDMTGLAAYGSDDPEPEYVSINEANIAAVSLQENNHLAIVDLASGKILNDFSAGSVSLSGVDTVEDDVISLTGNLENIVREPDTVAWLSRTRMITANEGDLFGGSRGFSVFNTVSGQPVLDAGNTFEYLAVRSGHYPENRSENKGSEPEGLTVGQFGNATYAFVGSERGNFVAVYRSRLGGNALVYQQLLPSGVGPEGLLTIPSRNLLVVANEVDEDVRSQITIYRLQDGAPTYPQIESVIQKDGKPIAWGALSALAADRINPKRLYSVQDSYYKQSAYYTVSTATTPARIIAKTVLMKNGATVDYDLEGITQRSDGSFWAASEGKGSASSSSRTFNLLVKFAADGTVMQEVKLPDAVNALQTSNGFEGVATTGQAGSDEKVYVAFQREWKNDPKGLVRIGVYTPALDTDPAVEEGEWRFFYYPLDAVESPAGGWVGLSEITALGEGRFAVIERDNQPGLDARIKKVYTFSIAGLTPKLQSEGSFPVVTKTQALDLLPAMQAGKGWVHDKIEGFAISRDGAAYAVTDNDGVDDSTGETQFLRLGKPAL